MTDQGEGLLRESPDALPLAVASVLRSVRAIHGHRMRSDIDAHVCIAYCSEDRQDWPCATERTLRAIEDAHGCPAIAPYTTAAERQHPRGHTCPLHPDATGS